MILMVGFRALDLVTLCVTACYLVVWFHFTPVLTPVCALVGDPMVSNILYVNLYINLTPLKHSGIHCWRALLENTFGDPTVSHTLYINQFVLLLSAFLFRVF